MTRANVAYARIVPKQDEEGLLVAMGVQVEIALPRFIAEKADAL